MTLLDKLRYLVKPGLAVLLIPFFFACDDPSDLGLELDPSQDKTSTLKEVFTLPASSIYIDSLRTDNFQFNAFGQFTDSIYGKTRAISYNQYNINGGTLPTDDSLEFSSANIILEIRDVRAAEALIGEQIAIYEVKDTLYNQAVYLSNRSIDLEDTPLVTHTFDYNPEVDSMLNIPLPDEFGQFLYGRLLRADFNASARDSLLQSLYYYPPLAFVPGETNKGLFTFNLQPDTVAIYINMENELGQVSSFRFDFRDAHFTEVIRDRSGGKLSALTTEYTESTTPSSRSYMDMLAGIYTKIKLEPYLEFLEQQSNIIINRAELSLGAVEPVTPDFIKPIESVQYYFPNDNGRLNGAGVVEGNRFNNAMLTETFYRTGGANTALLSVSLDEEDSNYTTGISLFSQILYNNLTSEQDYLTEDLIVISPDFLGLGQTSFQNSEITLTIYYTTLNE